jgi:hypothetical protein
LRRTSSTPRALDDMSRWSGRAESDRPVYAGERLSTSREPTATGR